MAEAMSEVLATAKQESALDRWPAVVENTTERLAQMAEELTMLCDRLVGTIPSEPDSSIEKVGQEGRVHNMDSILARQVEALLRLETAVSRLRQVGL